MTWRSNARLAYIAYQHIRCVKCRIFALVLQTRRLPARTPSLTLPAVRALNCSTLSNAARLVNG